MVSRFFSFFIIVVINFYVDGIPDYRRCPVGCNCTSMSMATCNTMDFPSFAIDILKLRIIEPEKPLTLAPNFFSDKRLKEVDAIHIRSAIIEKIDPAAFDDLPQLVSVSFVNCTLPQIDPNTFVDATSLLILEFEDSPLKQFESIKSESLKQLKISGGGLTKITNDMFSYAVELSGINLADNNIEQIEENAFANLIGLEDLNVTNNKISTLPPTLFLNNQELVSLDLSGNPIESVHQIVAPKLEKLVLRNCMLSHFDGSNFTALNYLDLSNNKIDVLSETAAFQNAPELEYVDLSDNVLSTLPVDVFANNSRVQKIILDRNDLTTLPKFRNDETFQTYFFSCNFCKLENLEGDVFEYMPGLIILNLSNNRIKTLSGRVFASIKSLTKLDLSHNLISTVEVEVFENNTALTSINLSGNQISYLDPNVFANNGVLKSLDVSNNILTRIWKRPAAALLLLHSLRVLNVAGNKLETITREELEITKNLETLNINDNDLQCTEDLRMAIEWLTNNSVTPDVINTHEELINIDYASSPSESDNDFIWQDIIFDSCEDNGDYDFTEDLSIINRGIQIIEDHATQHVKYNFLWLVLVFILTALLVLFLVLNIILFILRKRGQLPRNMNLTWKNGHGGFVYKPLTEDIARSQYNLEKSAELPIVHRLG